MRPGLKTLLAAVLAAALVVPGATAQPGNGNGNAGGGKPSWAGPPSDRGGGSGKPSWAGQGKPDFAGQGKPDFAGQGGGEDDEAEGEQNGENGERTAPGPPAELPEQAAENPAKTCAAERSMDPEAFKETYGTNESEGEGDKMNAFGMCVSQEAEARDEEEAGGELEEEAELEQEAELAGDSDESEDSENESEAEGSEDEGDGSGAQASILALLRALF
ncbi:MAG TPA: hypothetical protein VE644_09315 [Gaiellaceae bacterium]|nr:hypothetical protein [Gaiellaceae bacterium]